MEPEIDELEERLRKQGWYLGEVTEEVATSILRSGPHFNTFVVYHNPGGSGYTLSARFRVEGLDEDIVEHFPITSAEEGRYQLPGQAEANDDIITAVNSYVTGRDTPLTPALGKTFVTQLSIPDDPPSYSQAHRALAPDIAPLPDIAAVSVEPVKEAKAGKISPTGSLQRHQDTYRGYGTDDAPPHMDNPHWYRYQDHLCLHPKNCWHCCCYRETYWTGYRERYSHKWYSLRGNGPLRLLLVLLFWMVCGLCVGCGMCCVYCCILCAYCCCDIDDD